MADIPINEVTRRVQFTGNTTTGPFAFTFNILSDDDIIVYKNSVLQTITTHYTVSTNANGTGSITLTSALVASDVLTIIGGRALERTTDFVTAGDLLASSLNEQLDSQVIMAQQLDEKLDRALKVDIGDQFTDLSLPSKANRLGTVLGFNATSGDPEAGPQIADVSSLAAITADIATLADIEDGTDATDAIQTVAGISSNVSTVAGISGNVTTVAGISSNVTTVAGISANTTTVAGISTDVTTVAGISSNVSTVAGISSNVTTVAGDSADIQALAAKTTELGLLGTADAIADMNTLATSAIVTDMDALANLTSEIDALGDVTSDITTVSGISANVTTVAGQISPTNNISTVAGVSSDISTVAGISSNVTTVAGISANVTTVAGDTTNIGTIATNLSGTDTIGTVAGSISNVNTVGGAIANVNTVASSISDVNSFANQYRISADNPTASLDAGDLAYVTNDSVLKYFNGTDWVSISPGIGNISDDTSPALGGNLNVAGNEITSASDGNVVLNPNGTGQIQLNSTVVVQDGTHDFDIASHDGSNGLKLGGTLVTSTAAEINVLDGIPGTLTATELGYVDGVTSGIQTQIDAKANIANPTFTTGITSPQVDITAQGDLRLQDSAGGQYVALQAPATISSSFTLTLPTADGSNTQVLQTNGSGVLSFVDAGGGQTTKISTATVSSSVSSVDITLPTSGYTYLKLHMDGVHPSTDAVYLEFQLSDDSGSTFEQQYYSVRTVSSSNGEDNTAVTSDPHKVRFNNYHGVGNAIYEDINGFMEFNIPSSASGTNYFWTGHMNRNNRYAYGIHGMGDINSTANLIRFSFASGTIEAGTFTLYGIA